MPLLMDIWNITRHALSTLERISFIPYIMMHVEMMMMIMMNFFVPTDRILNSLIYLNEQYNF